MLHDPGAQVRRAVERGPHSLTLVDFDETLWLRSSTEAYLDSIRPRWMAIVLLEVLDLVWLLVPGARRRHLYRDWLRVMVVTVCLPWSLARWRRHAPAQGRLSRNDELLAALTGSGDLHVVTLGFRPVVAPLLAGACPDARLAVASSLWNGYRLRAQGKRAALEELWGEQEVADALFVTDSADDADLLAAVRTPVLVRWPEARWTAAYAEAYLPLRYTQQGKRAGQQYLLHNVLLEDVVVLCLAFAWTTPEPLLVGAGLLLLHLSFWLVYEIGYHENDHVAVLRERAPNHPVGALAMKGRVPSLQAWLCALVVAVPGCLLVASGAGTSLRWLDGVGGSTTRAGVLLLVWTGYLLLARAAYWVYNRLAPEQRSLPYAVLQLSRTAGYGLLLTTNAAGVLALASLVLARWVPYLAYRDLGLHLQGSHRLIMLQALLVLGAVQAAAAPHTVFTLQAAVTLAYVTARAHRPLRMLLAHVPGPVPAPGEVVSSVRSTTS